ncbi:MAG: hypothetical protein H7X94_10360 [Vallitaleaceae bacterium]|nr:hypothetical protein [Vallitaleaceae bacterium]
MSLSPLQSSNLEKSLAQINSKSKNAPMSAQDFNTYLARTLLEIDSGSTQSLNADLMNVLTNNSFNQIALNALTLGSEPGVLNKNENNTPLNANDLMQKAYGVTNTIMDRAKAVAQKISTTYEGGQVTGNFDGQGLSVGYLQWNIGSGTLQPLLKEMASGDKANLFNGIFSEPVKTLSSDGAIVTQPMSGVLRSVLTQSKDEQIRWAKSINDENDHIKEPWKSAFETLVKQNAFIDIENQHSKVYQASANKIMNTMGVKTVRGYALAFDIAVQNGSLKKGAQNLVEEALSGEQNKLTNVNDPALTPNQRSVISDLNAKLKETSDTNLKKMYYTAAAVAISSNDRFAKDVWSRKSAIVAGSGQVHGSAVAFGEVGLSDHALS